ncbi:MAG TPA: hypothetical protein VMR18_04295 [Candidatus Saccharimonadales bacterium]|nr:hypothetical protein [Candidatus Saccharimonadales bacterium]
MTFKLSFKNIRDKLRQASSNTTLRAVSALILIALVAVAPHVYKAIWPTAYVARQDSFKIVFPGVPAINKIASKSDDAGGQEGGRIYSVLNQTAGTDYAVYVTRYSDLNASQMSGSATVVTLQDDIEQLAQSETSNLSGGKTIAFKGLNAVTATLTPTDTSDAPSIILAFLNNHDLYIILGSGISQSKFNSFANTFNFTS